MKRMPHRDHSIECMSAKLTGNVFAVLCCVSRELSGYLRENRENGIYIKFLGFIQFFVSLLITMDLSVDSHKTSRGNLK